MNAAAETRKLIKQRDAMLRDAYHGRNGLSMAAKQRTAYKAMMDRVKEIRRISREQ